MSDPATFSDGDLHAYADGRLDASRVAAIEAWLATHPEEAARAAFYKRVNAHLHRLFDPVLDSPIPEGMSVQSPPRPWLRRVAMAAAAMLLLGVGLGLGWAAHQTWMPERVVEVPVVTRVEVPAPAPGIAQQAALAHNVYTVEVRHPVEVAADEKTHLITWLSRRLGHQLKVPDLEAAGFQFMGGRLLPGRAGGVASQFMYEDPAGTRLTLYVGTVDNEPATSLRYVTEDKVGIFYWVDDRMGYALAGAMERPQLYRLAHVVYEQINK